MPFVAGLEVVHVGVFSEPFFWVVLLFGFGHRACRGLEDFEDGWVVAPLSWY